MVSVWDKREHPVHHQQNNTPRVHNHQYRDHFLKSITKKGITVNLKQGQTVHLTSGTFKGYSGTILEIYTYNVNVEIEIFDHKTVVSVSLYELGIISKPPSMASLIEEFEQLYQQNAPLRYARLNDGIARQNIQSFGEELHVSHLTNAYIDLYTWKNGLPSIGWKNEFEEDSWYELLPLDHTNHFIALHKAVDVVSLWEKIA